MLSGLEAAHELTDDDGNPLLIVHRDVSPQNVLVGVDGNAKLTDFGVARATSRLSVTRAGQLKGKVAYMAPEQARGDAAVDHRADVFAAGVVLWEVLVGRPMFRAEEEVQLLAKVLDGQRDSPSSLVPGLEGFDHVVMRGLAMDPSQRWSTAREMARALEACGPLATPSEVGEWVESLAGERLAERATVISRIESQTGIPMPSAENVQREISSQVSNVRPTVSVAEAERQRAEAVSGDSAPARGTVAPGRALAVGGTAALVGILLAVVVATVLRRAPAAETAPAASAILAVPVAPTASQPVPSIDIDQLRPVTDPSPTAATDAPVKPRVQPPRVVPAGPAPAPAPAKRPGCDPPYTIDSDGVKHYKRECN